MTQQNVGWLWCKNTTGLQHMMKSSWSSSFRLWQSIGMSFLTAKRIHYSLDSNEWFDAHNTSAFEQHQLCKEETHISPKFNIHEKLYSLCAIGCCSCPDLFGFFSTFIKTGGCQRKWRIQSRRKKYWGSRVAQRPFLPKIWHLFDFRPLDGAKWNLYN